jgi:hypothetical protein
MRFQEAYQIRNITAVRTRNEKARMESDSNTYLKRNIEAQQRRE